MKTRTTGVLVGIGLIGLMTGCTVADPDTSQVAIHYTGGPFSSQNFDYCVAPGVREAGGTSDYDYYYPNGQRTYTFSDAPGSDASPIRVSTANQTELIVRGTVAFTLNTDCATYTDSSGKEWKGGKLQRFHDTIGRHKGAFANEGGEAQPQGWKDVLAQYVGGPAEKAMDNAGLGFQWQQLYSDADAKSKWEQRVLEELPKLIIAQAGADHFIINNIQLQKPDVPDSLRAELESAQAAGLRKSTADIDKSAAENFPGGVQGYLAYQQQLAINKAISEGKANINVVPQGSSIVVGQTPK